MTHSIFETISLFRSLSVFTSKTYTGPRSQDLHFTYQQVLENSCQYYIQLRPLVQLHMPYLLACSSWHTVGRRHY